MKPIEQHLTQYAAYHRDRRNIATHFVGIPMIVFSVILALETVGFSLDGWAVSAAAILAVVSCIYYLRLDLALGIAMSIALFFMCAGASEIEPRLGPTVTLWLAAAIFVAGWALQFLGHKYEGMKPAFYDDMMQLAIGPLFICAESFFMAGAKRDLRRHIEERVGPVVARRSHAAGPATH